MARALLITLLPLILPLLLYFSWRMVYGNERLPKWAQDVPWVTLGSIGLVLAALALGVWRLTTDADPGSVYEPPRFEDGQIVPGRFK